MKNALRKLISEHNLDRISEPLLAAAETGLRIVRQPSRADRIGTSRIGGLPDVPAGFVWPTVEGRSLSLLAQINCSEVAPHDTAHVLPASGLLHFFFDIEEQPWGFDPKDRGGAVVCHTTGNSLTAAQRPSELSTDAILPAIPVGFHPFLSIPSRHSGELDSIDFSEDEDDAFFELFAAVRDAGGEDQPGHQLLGHPDIIQNDMRLECQLVTHGLYCGNSEGYSGPEAERLKPGASDWRLLLQFDSDDDLNIMWGDCGMVYFWIRSADLQQSNFNNTWTILQCS